MNIWDALGWFCGIGAAVCLALALVNVIGRLIDWLFAGPELLDRPGRGSCATKRGR
jgi:hypothetical protein